MSCIVLNGDMKELHNILNLPSPRCILSSLGTQQNAVAKPYHTAQTSCLQFFTQIRYLNFENHCRFRRTRIVPGIDQANLLSPEPLGSLPQATKSCSTSATPKRLLRC
jgi:hypothetical protein